MSAEIDCTVELPLKHSKSGKMPLRAQTQLPFAMKFGVAATAIICGAVSNATQNPLLVVAAFLLLILCMRIRWRISLLQCIVIGAPLMLYLPLAGRVNFSVADVLIPIAVIAILSDRGSKRGSYPSFVLYYSYFVLALSVFSMALVAWKGQGGASVFSATIESAKLAVGLVTFVLVCQLAWRAVQANDLRFIDTWSATAGGVSFAALLPAITGSSAALFGGERSTGTFEDPNLLAFYLVLSIGFVSVSSFYRTGSFFAWTHVLLVFAAFSSLSRTGFVSMIIVLLLTAIVARSYVTLGIITIGAVLVWTLRDGVIALLPRTERFLQFEGFEDDLRSTLWEYAVGLWGDNPILGIGIGQFKLLSPEVTSTEDELVVHNTFLSFFVETGLLGGLLFVSIFVYLAILIKRSAEPGYSLPLLAAWAGGAVMMMSINVQNVRFLWVHLALTIVLLAAFRSTRATNRQPVVVISREKDLSDA